MPPVQAGALVGSGPGAAADARLEALADLLAAGYIEGEEITPHWDLTYVACSLAVAAFGAFVAFSTTMHMKRASSTRQYCILLARAGLALGVCTVWCMHFVGMQALVLYGGAQSGATAKVDVTFEPILTVSSALAAWLIATIALHVSLSPEAQECLLDEEDSESGECQRHRHMRRGVTFVNKLLHSIMESTPIKRISGASALVATGVCVMHYMGMLSQTGNFTMEYDGIVISASAVVAGVVSFAGLGIFFIIPDNVICRVLAAIVISVAVNSMHYTGMQAAKYYVHPHTGLWGPSTASWKLHALSVMIGVWIVNYTMMACNGFATKWATHAEAGSWWGVFAATLLMSGRIAVLLVVQLQW